jgi:hypothetical protein
LGVTAHPSAEWIARQLTEGGWSQPPRYIIRDRDGAYGEVFIRRLKVMLAAMECGTIGKFKAHELCDAGGSNGLVDMWFNYDKGFTLLNNGNAPRRPITGKGRARRPPRQHLYLNRCAEFRPYDSIAGMAAFRLMGYPIAPPDLHHELAQLRKRIARTRLQSWQYGGEGAGSNGHAGAEGLAKNGSPSAML